MYQTFFGFDTAPFSIAPDPRYLYMSPRHQEALATLLFGLRSDGGFVLLTGEVGAGKTTICRCLLEQIPDNCDVAYIFNPKLTVTELLSTICDEFGIAYPEGAHSIKRFVDLINQFLLESNARGRRGVLIIDEAQNLSPLVLEQIRLLTNLETNERKLLQILLLGQPELVGMLARPELRQLAQRIVARYHLMPLDKIEVADYVKHRLKVARGRWPIFPDKLWSDLYKLSGGVPRVINVLCDRALLGAFVQRKQQVDRDTLLQAAREVLAPGQQLAPPVRRSVMVGAALALAGAAIVAFYQNLWPTGDVAVAREAARRDHVAGTPAVPATQVPVRATQMPVAKVARESRTAYAMLALPPDVPNAQSRQLAFATLFNRLHVAYDDRISPCAQAVAQGLQCRTMHGGLDELRKLDQPVILHMDDSEGHPFYATLTGLSPHSAVFSFGAQIREVSVAAVNQVWRGEYTMLRRAQKEVNEHTRQSEHRLAPDAVGGG